MDKSGPPPIPLVASHTNETLPADAVTVADSCATWLECVVNENIFMARVIGSVLVLVIAWIVVKAADRALTRSADRIARLRRFDDYKRKVMVGRTKPMRMSIRLVMFVIACISLLAVWGLQTAFSTLLAGAGFAGIVVGLAAADTIGDIIAGFLIFYNHPFDLGDWVDIDGIEGTVEDVALGATTLLTFDNEKVTIPNRLVEGTKVKNFTAARKLRRKLAVGVEYGSHLGLAMQTLVELAKAHPDVLNDPEPSAVTQGFGPSSVDLVLRFYVEPIRSSAIKVYTDLVHQTHDTFRDKGIGIAFPHMHVVQSDAWKVDGRELPDL